MSFASRNGRPGTTNAEGSMKEGQEDIVTITIEDGSLPVDHEQDVETSDTDGSCMGGVDESSRCVLS